MLNCYCLLVAKGVVRDATDNNISIFSILEQINPVGLPFKIQELTVVAFWRRSKDDKSSYNLRLVVSNNAKELYKTTFEIKSDEKLLHRNILSLQGLLLTEPGELSFSIFEGPTEVSKYVITVAPPATKAKTQG